jgi:hypothetical protein
VSANLPFDVLIFVLRVLFILLLYLFLFQLVRVIARDLQTARPVEAEAAVSLGQLLVVEPGRSGLAAGVALPLQTISPIGRRLSNVVVVDDDFVSAEHALLSWRDGRWWLSDVASTNGTFLNGEEVVEPAPVTLGDIIEVGRVKLKLAK